MRTALAIAAVLLVLVTAVAPHSHERTSGTHACLACAASRCEEAVSTTPDAAPRAAITAVLRVEAHDRGVGGIPLGAIPGQSPPAHSPTVAS